MDSDEEDFVFYGTPIQREEEITTRKKKAVAEASGNLRALPAWKQEVTDEEGRRRFHGAFTGGFSAGYYNTVGSKEGWTPQTFTSSRKNRAEIKQQDILNFLDDDEKAEMEGRAFGTSMQFDTFGFTAAEVARKQAEKEQQQRPSIIPGPAPDEIVLPATDSIGVKLLLKMGWRHGRAIKDPRMNSSYDVCREARKAFLVLSSDDTAAPLAGIDPIKDDFENLKQQYEGDEQVSRGTPVFVLNPKQDLHGLGFDPFKHAPEFKEKKRSRLHGTKESRHRKPLSMKESLFGLKSGRVAPGFGIGALEELDIEDEDVYASGYDFEETYVQESEEPTVLSIEQKKKWSGKEEVVLPGFRPASCSERQLERFDPPVIPKGFVPHHTFPALDRGNVFSGSPPGEISPPEDKNLKIMIDGVATMVVRCGKLFEDLSREKNKSNPLFSFLYGGDGHEYYAWKLWEEKQKRDDGKTGQLVRKEFLRAQKLTAESRGKILGEKPLDRSPNDKSSASKSSDVQLQYNLVDTFTTPASFSEAPDAVKPFRDDPAKQERFEQFLKEKYRGGLRSKDAGGASKMSEAARARERLEFEAAAEAIAKGKRVVESRLPNQQPVEISVTSSLQFTSGGSEKVGEGEDIAKKAYPKREEFQWRPSPILCKRFDIMDPYMGKPPPPPRPRSKMDSLLFMPDSVKSGKVEETTKGRTSLPGLSLDIKEIDKEADEQIEVNVEVENVERPIDLYKAIFSDDSDEEEGSSSQQADDPQKKIEVVNTTLNRLIAGDFLESLGKELGIEVPPDLPLTEYKTSTLTGQKESITSHKGDVNTILDENNPQATPKDFKSSSLIQGDDSKNGRTLTGTISSENKPSKPILAKDDKEDEIARNSLHRHGDQSSSSSEYERKRKHSRHRRHRSSSDSDVGYSSDDYGGRRHRRSKERRNGSSREKSSSRKHSRRHKHRRGDSPSRASRWTDGEREAKKGRWR